MNIFPQRETLTDLENKLCLSKSKSGGLDKLRLGLPYVYKCMLNICSKKPDHIQAQSTEHSAISYMGRGTVHEYIIDI